MVADVFSGLFLDTWLAGTAVALVAGVVGFFAVLRGSAFAAHAVPQSSFAGAALASLVGFNPLVGLGSFAVVSAGGIFWLGRRARQEVATALVLVFLLGLGWLFLSWSSGYAAEAYSLLFGEILGVSTLEVVPTALLGACAVGVMAAVFRPLLLASTFPELAEAKRVPRSAHDFLFLLVMALVTTMSVPVVGALLLFSLMVGPPAAARLLVASPRRAVALSVALALGVVWTSIALSYESGWPIGFFVGVLSATCYAAGRLAVTWGRRLLEHLGP